LNGSDAVKAMKETLMRRITFTSSLNEILLTSCMGIYCRVVVRGKGVAASVPTSFYSRLMVIYIKDDVNGFFSTLDICCMLKTRIND
jgi:hypothetical protein